MAHSAPDPQGFGRPYSETVGCATSRVKSRLRRQATGTYPRLDTGRQWPRRLRPNPLGLSPESGVYVGPPLVPTEYYPYCSYCCEDLPCKEGAHVDPPPATVPGTVRRHRRTRGIPPDVGKTLVPHTTGTAHRHTGGRVRDGATGLYDRSRSHKRVSFRTE